MEKMDFSSRCICKSLGSYLFDLLPQMLHSLFTENEYFSVPNYLLGRK